MRSGYISYSGHAGGGHVDVCYAGQASSGYGGQPRPATTTSVLAAGVGVRYRLGWSRWAWRLRGLARQGPGEQWRPWGQGHGGHGHGGHGHGGWRAGLGGLGHRHADISSPDPLTPGPVTLELMCRAGEWAPNSLNSLNSLTAATAATALTADGNPVPAGWGGGEPYCSERVLRAASFRLDTPLSGTASLGIAMPSAVSSAVLVDLLAGLARPSYGELRVLGEDLTTSRGRSALRGQVGVARRIARPQPTFRVRGLVEHAARLSRLPARDRGPLAAAIVDRLSLTPWADVPVRAVPEVICRRARLAAAAVHQPDLLLIDGLLDGLEHPDASSLADAIRDLGRDMTIVATGRDPAVLALACGEVLTMADGIIVSPPEDGGTTRLTADDAVVWPPRDAAAGRRGTFWPPEGSGLAQPAAHGGVTGSLVSRTPHRSSG